MADSMGSYVAVMGDGASRELTLTHNLMSRTVTVTMLKGPRLWAIRWDNPQQCTLFFKRPPRTGSVRITVERG